jgi:hypothetical protein
MLEQTKKLLASSLNTTNPLGLLSDVLVASIELVSIEGNDFSWSSWNDRDHAVAELQGILKQVQAGVVPEESSVSVLFAPTGPLQELSMSSGWAETYLRLAERYDTAERLLWNEASSR